MISPATLISLAGEFLKTVRELTAEVRRLADAMEDRADNVSEADRSD